MSVIRAIISQSHGVAVFEAGDRMGIVDASAPEDVRFCDERLAANALKGARDIEPVEVADIDALRHLIDRGRRREELFWATLILLDSQRPEALRVSAASQFSVRWDEEDWSWVLGILLSTPPPASFDVSRAAKLLRQDSEARSAILRLQGLLIHAPALSEAWARIPSTIVPAEVRHQSRAEAVRGGWFRDLAHELAGAPTETPADAPPLWRAFKLAAGLGRRDESPVPRRAGGLVPISSPAGYELMSGGSTSPHSTGSAYILAVDVVAFSALARLTQIAVVQSLSSDLAKAPLFRHLQDTQHVVTSTGDGFLLVVASDRPDFLQELVEFATELVGRGAAVMSDGRTAFVPLAGALHVGAVALGLDLFGSVGQASGTGISASLRILALAAPSQVLVSRQFEEHVRGEFGGSVARLVDGLAVRILFKHGEVIETMAMSRGQLYVGASSQVNAALNVERTIERLVSGMGPVLSKAAQAARSELNLQIWEPGDNRLVASAFWAWPQYASATRAPASPEHVVPRAFQSGNVEHESFSVDPSVEESLLYTSVSVLGFFAPQRRTILAIPLRAPHGAPVGVLSVEFPSSEPEILQNVYRVAEHIRRVDGSLLAVLLGTRRP